MALIGRPDPPRALVLRALGMGDLLTCVPALRALHRGLPDHHVVLAAPSWLTPLAELTGAVDELQPTPDLAALRHCDPPPDVGVNLHGRGPQSIQALQRSGAERLLSHRHPDVPGVVGPDWEPDLHEVARWCRLLTWYGLSCDPSDLRLDRPVGQELPGEPVTIAHPGASAPARRWPADRFVAVARELTRRGHRVVVTGSRAEIDLGERLVAQAGLPSTAMLAGQLDLAELAALVSAARLVVCGDTGLGHLASAYGVPSVLLFGPTSPQRWGPPPGPHTVLWAGSEGDPHADTVDAGLLGIGVTEVLEAVRALEELPVRDHAGR